MTLSMKMFKDKVRFEWNDGEVESVVTLSSEDDESSAVRKLKRVIALVEGEQASVEPTRPRVPLYRAHSNNPDAPPQTGNGWAAVYGPPEIPERLQGEVEMVEPGEMGGGNG